MIACCWNCCSSATNCVCLLLELLLKCYKLCVSWNILFTYLLVSRGLFTPLQQYSFGAQCMHNCSFWCSVSEFWSVDLIRYQLNIKLQFGLMCHGSPCCCFWMCIKLQLYKTLYNTAVVQNAVCTILQLYKTHHCFMICFCLFSLKKEEFGSTIT